MKTHPIKFLFLTAAVLCGAVPAHAQYSFDFEIPGGIQDPQYTNLSAYGDINFDFSNELVIVNLTHDSDAFHLDQSTSTLIGVAVLAPLGVSNLQFVNSIPGNWDDLSNVNPNFSPFPQANNVGFDLAGESYFGVGSGKVKDGLVSPPPSSLTFTFSFDFQLPQGMDEDAVWSDYVGEDVPQVFVRWQQLFEEGNWPGSTIGWNNPVPEPSTIGALSIAGLGGLLWVRRRIKSRAARRTA
jgi:hypothetical protein